jgi:integrase
MSQLIEMAKKHKLAAKQDTEKSKPVRVLGPYCDAPSKYRLVISEDGKKRSVCFKTVEEAEDLKNKLIQHEKQAKAKTIGELVDLWLDFMDSVRGQKQSTSEYLARQLKVWLPIRALATSLSEATARALYAALVDQVCPHTKRKRSVTTHQLYLYSAKRVWNWATEQGLCKSNPWLKVTPIGRKSKGKPQLRIDEARKLEAVAMQRAKEGDVPALGTLLMMYLGLRQGEVTARVARDIDDDGRVLWVPFGKTHNARRRLRIPEQLRPLILRLMATKRADEPLFYPATHKRVWNAYYNVRVRALCRLAGVPEVVPHSLRGLHATLALEGGATADAVAKALGHSSFAMTEQHYASPSSVSNARSSRVAQTLGGGEKPFSELLNSLSEVDRQNLLSELQARGERRESTVADSAT